MKKILVSSIVCLAVVLGVIFFFRTTNDAPPVNTPPDGFPTTTNTGGITGTSGTIALAMENGDVVEVANFLDQPSVVEDTQNSGYYYLGNHFPAGASTTFTNPEYVIEYIAETQFFNIALLQEPVAASRQHAETYLMQQLGITEEQMCALKYTVSVPRTVNSYFAGDSLGFSFCPGSFPLE